MAALTLPGRPAAPTDRLLPMPPEPTPPAACASALRVGAVRYLNSRPLIEGLDELLGNPCDDGCRLGGCGRVCRGGATLELELPSRLADGLAGGRLDAALVPSAAVLRSPGLAVIGDACVASAGPVRSVKAYFRRPPGEVRTAALDEGSRTSAALLRVLLAERFGVELDARPLPIEATPADAGTDVVLMIGDRAMHDPLGPFEAVWDLGEEWFRWTGLPFVFAVWAAADGAELGPVPDALSAARDRGVAAIDAIAAREAGRLQLDEADAAAYLRRNLHFTLGPAERAGLAAFGELLS